MKCVNCKKKLIIPDFVFLNLETYNTNGCALITTECCGTGYLVKMNTTYKITLYTGEKETDDWGNKIYNKNQCNHEPKMLSATIGFCEKCDENINLLSK